MRSLQYLNKYLYKYRIRLVLGMFFTIAAKVFAVVAPSLVGDSITQINQYLTDPSADLENTKQILIKNIGFIIGAAILAGGFTFIMRQTIINVSRFIEFDLKNEIYQHYQKLSLGFYKNNRTGDLMNRISEDVSKVRMYFGPALMYSINTISLFIIVISYMVSVAPMLTLYALAPLPLLSLAIYQLSRSIHKRSTIVQEYLSKLSAFAQEMFSGIGVIKATAIESTVNEQMGTLAEGSMSKNMSLVHVQAWFFPLMILLIGLSNVLVIFIGGKQFINGEIDLGTLAEFIIYINMLTWPVATVGWVTSIIQQAEASQKRINEFLGQEPEIVSPKKALPTHSFSIEFQDVCFTYGDGREEALKNINFRLESGKTLAVLGRTGGGKTTMINLITRMFDPSSGIVRVGGVDVKKLDLSALRGYIGCVPQEAFLFSDTLENNIKFGNAEATQSEIEEAAKNAAVHDSIMDFSMGYQTRVGERGVSLSGGQKQRMSIARALIKKPKILLLDDSLSAVDTQTEELILNNLENITNDITMIVVCHRISSAKNADYILVLNEGKVDQFGTHKTLIKEPGHYADLHQKQL
ncbi:MAG: ABC transporter ATP-binding protein [Flavobacteriaceae bacterium]|nr:ABC transporter ATP-binding protein [Flavobacteriaceae bacterium]